MNAVQFLWILSVLAICSAIRIKIKTKPEPTTTPKPDTTCNQEVCYLEDVQCVTKGCNNVYKNAIVDPLYIEKIIVPSMNGSASYTLIKIEVKGLKNCVITELAPNTTSNTFKCTKCCPKLVVNYIFQGCDPSGVFVTKTTAVIAENVVAQSVGDFALYIGKDYLPHFYIKFVSAIIDIEGTFTIAPTNENPYTPTEEANIKKSSILIFKVAVTTVIELISDYCGKYPLYAILPKQ